MTLLTSQPDRLAVLASINGGVPTPPYIFFKYDGHDWKRIALEEFPAELNKSNLIVGSPPSELLKSFYTVEQVNEQNKDIRAAGYKTIIRKSFPIEENRCPELVYYKGAWVSPGDSIGRWMMDHTHPQ